ncbi:hypothetical protein O181_088067 [Austropuccinia psidii MF-1]|uniref:Uncharacterized protein n=1 Tax=Austropuccinia psidii MF-1 TaxID=1389203 RepID=A0A9Q3IQV4_9BASI|nr:hypothetical protein [Austropuccinia psidii MF-1]
MVHTRNRRSYSVQPDGSAEVKGNTRPITGNSFSRKTYLEDARVVPHSPRSVATTLEIEPEPELLQGNFLRSEPFTSFSHRDISVPVKKLVQRSQGRGVGNISKPLSGGYELLVSHQKLSGSGEDHRTLRRMVSIVLQRQGQKDKELVERKSFTHRPEKRVGNDLSFGEVIPSGINKQQASSRSVQRQAQITSEEEERSQEP